MKVYKLSKETADALAKKIERITAEAEEAMAKQESGGQFPFYFGYMEGSLKRLVAEIKTGGFLSNE